ncbi:MAG: HDIG domain-containing protein [Paludibacter sp.]|nr:HDIG domain-containing protein [Paludibacter sp.]
MKLIINKFRLEIITKIALIICVIAIIVQLYPSQNKFNYQFDIGKPWSYELMTASFDFPIYKNEHEIEGEKKILLQRFSSYFKADSSVYNQQINRLIADQLKLEGRVPEHLDLIKSKLKNIYAQGIISSDKLKLISANAETEINCILPNRYTEKRAILNLYTPKTAYEKLIDKAPEKIREYNLNNYIVENLIYDSLATVNSRNEILKNLSQTAGMVQTGERIIDRGEIVNPESYKILKSLKIEFDKRKASIQQTALVKVGQLIIISALIALFFLYLKLFRPRIYENFGNLVFISLLILMMTGLASLSAHHQSIHYFMIPYALLPIIIRVFFDSRTALFAHIITMLTISFMVDNPFQFVILQIIIGMVAVSSLKDMTQRSQLAQTALYILLAYIGLYLSFEFIAEGEIERIHYQPIIYFLISSTILLFAYLLIYIFEKIFGLISSLTLVELTNVNSDLMISFAEKAPGTFQHTLQVSNLATEAAKKIGANSLLVRTGALYHDIGKMKNPELFIENQFGANNPLKEMPLEDAAKLIIDHVNAGVEIAKKSHLPEQIINFITTHHGLSKTKYFYNLFVNENPDIDPNDALFTYPGPLPNSKETAILMMADAVEARVRSLGVYTNESISDAVEQMIDSQIADGQFKDAPISFRDVETVKQVFKEKVKNMYHSRIVYPELKKTLN